MPRENQRPLDTHRLLTALCEADVAFVIVGGMAAVAQGAAYITADLDICYQRTPINFQRLSKAVRSLHPSFAALRPAFRSLWTNPHSKPACISHSSRMVATLICLEK